MRIKTTHLLHFCIMTIMACGSVYGASPTPLSNYGNIQNVQNYSSNPFWQGDSYKQRMPTPVYVDGPDVKSGTCNQIMAQMVSLHCGMRNNCQNVQLKDIRPAIMTQLSQMSDANYSTSCAGYLDGAFNDYIRQHGTVNPPIPTIPAHATQPTPDIPTPITMPQPQQPTENWKTDMATRRAELAELRAATGGDQLPEFRGEMPTVAADFSFEDRVTNATDGYQPFADTSAYKPIVIESKADYTQRRITAQENEKKIACLNKKPEFDKMVLALNAINRCRATKTKLAKCSGIKDFK